jgi:hypothetical protein
MSSLTPEAYAVIEGRPADPLWKVQGLPDEKTELTRRERIRSEHMYWTGCNSSDARCNSMRRNNGGAGATGARPARAELAVAAFWK